MHLLCPKNITGLNKKEKLNWISNSIYSQELINKYNFLLNLYKQNKIEQYYYSLKKLLNDYEDQLPARDSLLEIIRLTILQVGSLLIRKTADNSDWKIEILGDLLVIFSNQDYYSNSYFNLFYNLDLIDFKEPILLTSDTIFFENPIVRNIMEVLLKIENNTSKDLIKLNISFTLVEEFVDYLKK